MTIDNPMVSIIVCSYRDFTKLKQCIKMLGECHYEKKEIIVVSFGIPENTIKIDEIANDINKLIILKEDLGISFQKNIGFKNISPVSKYALFVDDDVMVSELTITNLVDELEKNPEIGIAQSVLVTTEQIIDCAGGFIDFLGYTYLPYKGETLSFFKKTIKKDFPISYAAGACFLLKVNLFNTDREFSPFDNIFYFNYEDADLSLRAWLRGIKVVCVPSAVSIHKKGRTALLKNSPSKFIYLNVKHKFLTLTSVYEIKKIFLFVPLFLIFESIEAVLLFNVKSDHALSTFKAIFRSIFSFKEAWIRRKKILRTKIGQEALSKIILLPNLYALSREFRRHYA